jgi:hypothetical protein
MTMNTAVPAVPRFEHMPDLLRLRSHAAMVRALLEELERSGVLVGRLGALMAVKDEGPRS